MSTDCSLRHLGEIVLHCLAIVIVKDSGDDIVVLMSVFLMSESAVYYDGSFFWDGL